MYVGLEVMALAHTYSVCMYAAHACDRTCPASSRQGGTSPLGTFTLSHCRRLVSRVVRVFGDISLGGFILPATPTPTSSHTPPANPRRLSTQQVLLPAPNGNCATTPLHHLQNRQCTCGPLRYPPPVAATPHSAACEWSRDAAAGSPKVPLVHSEFELSFLAFGYACHRHQLTVPTPAANTSLLLDA